MSVEEHTIELDGSPAFYRRVPVTGETTPVLLHDVPTSSDDLLPVLRRTGGLAPDLPGFGRSGKGGHLTYTVPALADAVTRLLDVLAIGPVRLIGHGWGAAVAVEIAAAAPGRVERLTLVGPAPDHGRLERALRTPLLGELVMGSTGRWALTAYMRQGGNAAPDAFRHFDQGTQRAILRLLRATPRDPAGLLARPPDVPTTVLRGARDPWVTEATARAFADSPTTVPEAGHWPWLDRPEALASVAA